MMLDDGKGRGRCRDGVLRQGALRRCCQGFPRWASFARLSVLVLLRPSFVYYHLQRLCTLSDDLYTTLDACL
jgi:hypothetical protein